jgi:hypothetical protein
MDNFVISLAEDLLMKKLSKAEEIFNQDNFNEPELRGRCQSLFELYSIFRQEKFEIEEFKKDIFKFYSRRYFEELPEILFICCIDDRFTLREFLFSSYQLKSIKDGIIAKLGSKLDRYVQKNQPYFDEICTIYKNKHYNKIFFQSTKSLSRHIINEIMYHLDVFYFLINKPNPLTLRTPAYIDVYAEIKYIYENY